MSIINKSKNILNKTLKTIKGANDSQSESRAVTFNKTLIDLGEVELGEELDIVFTFDGDPGSIHAWTADCGCTVPSQKGNDIQLSYTPPSFKRLITAYPRNYNSDKIAKEVEKNYPDGYFKFQKGVWVTDKANNKHRLEFKGRGKLPDNPTKLVKEYRK